MTALNSRTDGASGTQRRGWWRSAALRAALAAAFVAILIGLIYATGESVYVAASLAGFAVAITLIAAATISWERLVMTAQSAGLVERPH
jgi:hypothetical protein